MVCASTMRTNGSAAELERRRRLAVKNVRNGRSVSEVASFLDVDPRSVRRWVAAATSSGLRGLRAQSATGRPPKLDHLQEKVVRRWLSQSPTELGFDTDLWTSRRLTQLIRQAWGIAFNVRYLCDWLGHRGYSPQKPQRVPRERDESAIANWKKFDWPRIQKKHVSSAQT